MNISLKKKLSLLLAFSICMCAFVVAPFAFGDDLIAINATSFPDDTFRALVSEEYDTNGDGYLSAEERSTSFMSISGMIDVEVEQIRDLKGIEFFTNLRILRCGGIGLESLDTTALYNLTSLSCQGNSLTYLNTSYNRSLQMLNCSDNDLETLLLPNVLSLTTLYCYANSLTSIDTQQLYNLTDLRCDQNELTALNLQNNTNLTALNCSQNHLTSLDLSKTAIADITDYEIGEQTVDMPAVLSGNKIIVPFNDVGLTFDNYRGCSLDLCNDGSCFEGDQFVAYDVNNIKDGIIYECYPQLDNAENMTVIINVIRDFYQVDFFTDAGMTQNIGKCFVYAGENATQPQLTDTPQCKSFSSWSEPLNDINEDKSIYAIWEDAHSYRPIAIAADGDTITVACAYNDSSYQVSYLSVLNSKTGDSNFDINIDVVADGHINAKDYAKILKSTR